MSNTFSEKVVVLVPPAVNEVLEQAAKRRFQSRSEYMRAALLARLAQDGLCPVPTAA